MILKADAKTDRRGTCGACHTPAASLTPSLLDFFIKSDNVALVKKFLDSTHTDVNAKIHSMAGCDTILSMAVRENAHLVVAHLLETGVNISARGHWRYDSPLYQAVFQGKAHMAQLLLEHGALRVYSEDKQIQSGQLFGEPLDGLVDENAVVLELLYIDDGLTLLHRICYQHERATADAARILVEAGANIDALTTPEGLEETPRGAELLRRTALNYTLKTRHFDACRTLLEMGASVQGAVAYDIGRHPQENDDNRSYFAPTPLYELVAGLHGGFKMDLVQGLAPTYTWWSSEITKALDFIRLLMHHGLRGQQGIFDEHYQLFVDVLFAWGELVADSSELWEFLCDVGLIDVYRRNEFGQTFLAQLVSRCYGAQVPTWLTAAATCLCTMRYFMAILTSSNY
ncbi:hypothetical protein F4777DRAFT_435339 [Nemania sp. FL0916]|nr:hypothetical protein F4777DRAFT_435339 [Nemania sp. FL0916]